MKTINLIKKVTATVLVAALFFSSCKKADLPSGPTAGINPISQKEFSVFISDAPTDLQQVFIDIQKVEIKELSSPETQLGDAVLLNDTDEGNRGKTSDEFGTWITLPFAPQQINLLDLQNGNESLLGTVLVRNNVSKIRITLGANSYAVDKQGNQKPLLLDLSNESIFYVDLTTDDLDEDPAMNKVEARIDFNLFKSISDNNGVMALTPTMQAFSNSGYGEIRGIVTPVDANATIMVEDQNGFVTKAIPGPNGEYRIRGLKADMTYSITLEAENYISQRIENVILEKGKFTSLGAVELIH